MRSEAGRLARISSHIHDPHREHADIKTVQSLVRHANPRLTLEVYTHATDKKKRTAQSKVIEMVVPRKQIEGQECATGS